MHYENFSVHLSSLEEGAIRTRVLSSPAGEDQATSLRKLPIEAGREIRERFSDPDQRLEVGRIKSFGRELFESLLPLDLVRLWERSRSAAGHEAGIRLRLHMDVRRQSEWRLGEIPWELVCDPVDRHQSYLCLDRRISLVRYYEVPEPSQPVPRELPLRVLMVCPQPRGVADLGASNGWQSVVEGWSERDGVEVEYLVTPTRSGLRAALVAKPWHVVHFMGHGDLDPLTGETSLLFETDHGRVDLVDGHLLARMLRGTSLPRLFVLSACDTATTKPFQAPRTSAVSMPNVAGSLLAGGVPAVIAMQSPICNRAADVFSRRLYQRLADGALIDDAVAEGRVELHLSFPERLDWAIPVLCMRIPDGRLFAAREKDVSGDAPVGGEDRVELEARRVKGRQVFTNEFGRQPKPPDSRSRVMKLDIDEMDGDQTVCNRYEPQN